MSREFNLELNRYKDGSREELGVCCWRGERETAMLVLRGGYEGMEPPRQVVGLISGSLDPIAAPSGDPPRPGRAIAGE